jgi:L-amino acid N-acyltransferase YncA
VEAAMIRLATTADAEGICAIYNHYDENTTVTFEETPVTPAAMAERIVDIQRTHVWCVACQDDVIAGYAYAGPWRTRAAYRFAVETTVYLDPNRTRQGLGRALYGRLLADLRGLGFHCAMGGVALPNEASVALHERMGFVKVAHFREVGFKFDRWIDVAYWQRAL